MENCCLCDILSWLTRLPNVVWWEPPGRSAVSGCSMLRRLPSRNILDEAQEPLLALGTATSGDKAEHRQRSCPSGTGFKGEDRVFNPNTPRPISQSASPIGARPGGKRENRGRDRAGAMPGSSTKPGKASSERITPICRLPSSDARRRHSKRQGRELG